ncbi:hypothetical protein BU23DRAFT_576947 [Bimuria novae-zelandiae CBS 107.79]|uniref:Dynein n=1 Tax=Bimuria novae-zelandiae CBS 107.79 TaxID=1447943 RepID=A0A6A5VRZ3_9PLEO|nr:hypothetical protein BU23DRAFT_576947 [Bimuria novae-zelandiae CBS 107.79]
MANARRSANFPVRWLNSRDQEKEEIWKPLLDNISSGKRLPEKSVLVLGGILETQNEFLDLVATDPANNRRPPDRGRRPPVANKFALGYTYQDVLDTNHEDTLARLLLYLLADPSPSFTPLIKPYLNPRTLPHMLVLRDWIRVLRSLILSLGDVSKEVLEENIITLQDKGRTVGGAEGNSALDNVKVLMGPGEWDEPLGILLCVVCQNADKIEALERERGWKEEEFDFILQCLRTILLKHGASLHNVTDRDRVLVPPNWDSWAKIRILRDGFDVEYHIPQQVKAAANSEAPTDGEDQENATPPQAKEEEEEEGSSATRIYEETIRNPKSDFPLSALHSKQTNGIEVSSQDTQDFLKDQVKILDQLRLEDENEAKVKAAKKDVDSNYWTFTDDASSVVEEHIGPMVKRLQERETSRANDTNATITPPVNGSEPANLDNNKLMSFFSGLIKKPAAK